MIKKIPRLFIPLNSIAFEWFNSGDKKWELRRYGRQYTDKNIYQGRVVELRKGYSNPSNALWGVVNEVIVFQTLDDVFENTEFKEIIPIAESKNEAIKISKNLFNNDIGGSKFILINIRIIRCPTIIEIEDNYIDLLLAGTKSTTIRKGKRDYKTGLSILFSENRAVVFKIIALEYRLFYELTEEDADKDGFSSLNDLANTLHKFYPDLCNTDIVTIVSFELSKGDK